MFLGFWGGHLHGTLLFDAGKKSQGHFVPAGPAGYAKPSNTNLLSKKIKLRVQNGASASGRRRIQPAQGGSPGGGLTATHCAPNAQVCSILPLNMFADLLASSAQHTCTFRWWEVHYIHRHASCTINKGYAHTMADLQGSAHSRDCLELWPWPSYP